MASKTFLTVELKNLIALTGFFVLLALLFYFVKLGQLAWDILLLSALVWFVLEASKNRKALGNALKIGVFLLVFDFIFENSGWIYGLWQTHSMFAIGVVPIEVMGIALFGGAAWAMYLPKKFNLFHSAIDCVVFALFGSLGEWLLIQQGLFVYNLWWTSILAFCAYFVSWVILHFVRYKVIKE